MNKCIEIRKLNSRLSAQNEEDIRVLKTVYDASPNYFKTVKRLFNTLLKMDEICLHENYT